MILACKQPDDDNNLRRRTHDRQLHEHQGHLSDCIFITRLLYKNSYRLNNIYVNYKL